LSGAAKPQTQVTKNKVSGYVHIYTLSNLQNQSAHEVVYVRQTRQLNANDCTVKVL